MARGAPPAGDAAHFDGLASLKANQHPLQVLLKLAHQIVDLPMYDFCTTGPEDPDGWTDGRVHGRRPLVRLAVTAASIVMQEWSASPHSLTVTGAECAKECG